MLFRSRRMEKRWKRAKQTRLADICRLTRYLGRRLNGVGPSAFIEVGRGAGHCLLVLSNGCCTIKVRVMGMEKMAPLCCQPRRRSWTHFAKDAYGVCQRKSSRQDLSIVGTACHIGRLSWYGGGPAPPSCDPRHQVMGGHRLNWMVFFIFKFVFLSQLASVWTGRLVTYYTST